MKSNTFRNIFITVITLSLIYYTYQIPTTSNTYLSKLFSSSSFSSPLSLSDYLTKINFSNYSLTRSEAEDIFYFITKHKEYLSLSDWESFSSSFIIPYEQCKPDRSFTLQFNQFKQCFISDPYTSYISNKNYKAIFNAISTSSSLSMTFYDYFILKKSMFAWYKCHSTKSSISFFDFKCAINYIIPTYIHSIDSDIIFKAGNTTRYKMNFVSFVRISKIAYSFMKITNVDNDDMSVISKERFIKAIKEGKSIFTKEDVDLIYKMNNHKDNVLSFKSYAYFYNLIELFNKYALSNDFITKEEMMKLFDDSSFDNRILFAIDNSIINIDKQSYEAIKPDELSKESKDNSIEKFYSFIQINEDKKNREVFFNIYSNDNKWTRKKYLKAFYIGRTFLKSLKKNTFRVEIKKILKNKDISWKFKKYNSRVSIDLILYNTILNIDKKINNVSKGKDMLTQLDLITLLKDIGCSQMISLLSKKSMKYDKKGLSSIIVNLQLKANEYSYSKNNGLTKRKK